jgi:hypothetical protein
MMNLDHAQRASAGACVAADSPDDGASRGTSRLGRFIEGFLRALHESRRRQGEREIARYRHLICMSDMERMI